MSHRRKNSVRDKVIGKKWIFFFFFLADLGIHCCARAFSSCVIVVRGLHIAVASLVAEHGL